MRIHMKKETLYLVALVALLISCSTLCSALTGIFAAGSRHLYLHCEGKRKGPVVILSTGLFAKRATGG